MTDSESRVGMVGGCLCGQLRYEASELIDAGYCHCRLCQRSSGAPVLAWATLVTESFVYIKGQAAVYSSSESGSREFCAQCGTQILFRDARSPDRVDALVWAVTDLMLADGHAPSARFV